MVKRNGTILPLATALFLTTTALSFDGQRSDGVRKDSRKALFIPVSRPQSSVLQTETLQAVHASTQRRFTSGLASAQQPQVTAAAAPSAALGSPVCIYRQVKIPSTEPNPVPRQAINIEDITPHIRSFLQESGLHNGVLTVVSRHTTTAITINEYEIRLARDVEQTLLQLIPPDERSNSVRAQQGVTYFHNDIDERPEGEDEAQRCRDNGWNIDDPVELTKWRAQEPINAHSHLLSMMLGSSESIPVVDGKMVIGQWQSILLVDLDGPRDRTVGLQVTGFAASE